MKTGIQKRYYHAMYFYLKKNLSLKNHNLKTAAFQ